MSNRLNNSFDDDNEFSGLSGLKTAVETGTNLNLNKKEGFIKTDTYGFHNPETGTKVYLGKKITGTHEISTHTRKNFTDTTTTTLGSVSIDTDFSHNANKIDMQEHLISRISIETDSFSTSPARQDSKKFQGTKRQVNMEENANSTYQNSYRNNCVPKKEKPVNQNLSIDISSGFPLTQLPSGNEPIELGSGRVAGLLGKGGMAKVYKIWNDKLEIFRAVKLLSPSHDRESWSRFLTESKISAKLDHPNIVEIHSIGDWHDLPYMEMELVEGETLSSVIHKYKALPSFLCSAIAVLVSRALAYAHSCRILVYGKEYTGIIHRDLKPSNIMVGKDGVVKLMDFGVARPVETGFHTVNTDSIVGTMHYFSPEQINGYPVDPLSDIYSFGAVLYEMICGVNPFPYKRMGDLVQAKLKNSYKRLEDFDAFFHPALASAAQVCLRTEKNSRFTSSSILRDHLEKIHRSLNAGTPEEVIASFFADPEGMYNEERQRRTLSTAAKAIGQDGKNADESACAGEQNMTVEKNDQRIVDESESSKYDNVTNQNKKRKSKKGFFLGVFIFIVILISAIFIGESYNFSLDSVKSYINETINNLKQSEASGGISE
ncbi:MAG: serine/threonine-protein kinase [Fibrobacter sp.]|nr:serine/threonine-protein kinase [Fibrobacter sp.]